MDNIDQMAEAIKGGIDNNSTDAPAMSIDPKTQQVSVVGDPNNVKPTSGTYAITFTYPEDVVAPEDRGRMKKNEDGEYVATVTYEGKRVKPLHRTTIAMDLAEILGGMDMFTDDGGYTTDTLNRRAAKVFLQKIDIVADVAVKVLDIPQEQAQYMSPESLVEFFIQLMNNEPNIVKESASFLDSSSVQKLAKLAEKDVTTRQQGTQQS